MFKLCMIHYIKIENRTKLMSFSELKNILM